MTAVRQFLYGTENPFKGVELLPLDLQGWNSESPVFERLIHETSARSICEVGTWKGASAIHMAKHLTLTPGVGYEIVCVDTWLGSLEFYIDPKKGGLLKTRNGRPTLYETFLSNAVRCGVTDVVVPFPATSSIAAKLFRHLAVDFDLVYIDAGHDEDDVCTDILAYAPLSAIVFGDDWDWPSVQSGVEKAALMLGREIEADGEKWILRR